MVWTDSARGTRSGAGVQIDTSRAAGSGAHPEHIPTEPTKSNNWCHRQHTGITPNR